MARSTQSKSQKQINRRKREQVLMPKLRKAAWERHEKLKNKLSALKKIENGEQEFIFTEDRVGTTGPVKLDGQNWSAFVTEFL